MKIIKKFLNNNSRKKIYFLVTTALASFVYINEALSQSNNFQGAYAAIGVGLEKNNTKIEQNASNIPDAGTHLSITTVQNTFFGFNSLFGSNSDAKEIIGRLASSLKNNETKPLGEISLGYLFSIESNFLIGLDTSYRNKNSDKTVQQSYIQSRLTASSGDDTIANIDGVNSVKINEKENWSLGISPSYAIKDDVMVYGRISYNQLNTQTSVKFSIDSDQDYQINKKIYGPGIGLGIRYNLQNNLFLNLFGDFIKYTSYSVSKSDIPPKASGYILDSSTNNLTSNINPQTYNLILSIGYKF
jgi:opacity protein-like surface antigen